MDQVPSRKRTHSKSLDLLEGVKIVLLDIEGTTTPIDFVTGTLFSYARNNLHSHLKAHWDSEECQADVEALRTQAAQDADVKGVVAIPDADADKDAIVSAVEANVRWQMDNDRKTTALKQLQGHIWREAFTSGKVKGRVYEDVVESMKQWTAAGIQVYIYSSGSVEAQKLLFAHTDQGDLSSYISGYFDTKTGPKREKLSYQTIAKEMSVKAGQVLFLSDIPAELTCARDAGMKTGLVMREGNHPVMEEEKKKYAVIETFSELKTTEESSPTKK